MNKGIVGRYINKKWLLNKAYAVLALFVIWAVIVLFYAGVEIFGK